MCMVRVVWTRLNTVLLLVGEVLLLHRRESCVLDQHVVHELIPVNSATRICIDSHEELIELFEIETFSQYSAECRNEL